MRDSAPDALAVPRAPRWPKVLALVVVGGIVLTAHQLGLFEALGEPSRVRRTLVELGPWGYLAFVASYALLQPVGMSGMVFVLTAPLIWRWPVAFALSFTGTLTASVVGFSLARFVARDWVSSRIPLRFRAYDASLAQRGFATVVTLRFLFLMHPMLHAFFGVSRVGFWTHLWGSAVAYLVPLLLLSFFGEKVFAALRGAPPAAWIGLGIAVVAFAIVYRMRARRPSR